jgi:hypothetical protein
MDTFAQPALTRSDRDLRGAGTEAAMPVVAVVRNSWREHRADYGIALAVLLTMLVSALVFLSF